MEDKTAERIFTVTDKIQLSIGNIEKTLAKQEEIIKNSIEKNNDFIKKVDDTIFHPESGCIGRNKAAIKVHQAKLMWLGTLLLLVLTGIVGSGIAMLWKK